MHDTLTMTHLAERLSSRRLALFVGADLPSDLTGLPSRHDLAAGLAARTGQDASLSLASVAQGSARGGNRWDFTDYLVQQLNTGGKTPRRLHMLIASLPCDHFIVTSYDDLLLRAFDAVGRRVNHLTRGNQLAFRNPSWPNIIQLYGAVSQPDTLVVSEDDHLRLGHDADKAPLVDRIRMILEEHTVLFLGCDLSDADFRLLWREVLDRMGRFASGAYAAVTGLSSGERQVWEDRRIHILEHDVMAVLESLSLTTTLQPETSTAPRAPLQPQAVTPVSDADERRHPTLLRVLTKQFDLEELRTLCFDLGVDYDELPGEGKTAKARELILYWTRRGRSLETLEADIRRLRPGSTID